MTRSLTIFFFSLWAGSCFAAECIDDTKVNTSLLSGHWADCVAALPVPTLEFNDDYGEIFKDEFTQAIATHYGTILAATLLDQARERGNYLVDCVRGNVSNLEHLIEAINRGEGYIRLDDSLNRLTAHLWEFLNLLPGNVEIEQPDFPTIPSPQINVTSRTTPRPTSDYFVDFYNVVEGVYANLYAYTTTMFLTGWARSRPYYKAFVHQYRNEVLNGPVLEAHKQAVDQCFRNLHVIKSHVGKAAWGKFEEAASLVNKISNDYNNRKVKEVCV